MDGLFGGNRIIPVLASNEPQDADWIASALVSGGLPVVEVTFRSSRAVEVLAAMAEHSELLVGAGTVTSAAQVEAALAGGARFVVSPGISRDVVLACCDAGVPVIPGVATPTEIMTAVDLGLRTVKFFPAEKLGGRSMLEALAPVFPDVRFVPTGGITPANARDYLALPSVTAVGGSWMFGKSWIAEKDADLLTQAVVEAAAIANEE